jgi:quinol monooxygenase YgiN
MFGTVARLKVKPGREQDLMAASEEWDRETTAQGLSGGAIAEYVFKLENAEDEFIMVAIFKDRESYFSNAQKPETDRQYRQMRELLEADPEWNDGEVIHSASFASVGI